VRKTTPYLRLRVHVGWLGGLPTGPAEPNALI
jgi:hypothetical protein